MVITVRLCPSGNLLTRGKRAILGRLVHSAVAERLTSGLLTCKLFRNSLEFDSKLYGSQTGLWLLVIIIVVNDSQPFESALFPLETLNFLPL